MSKGQISRRHYVVRSACPAYWPRHRFPVGRSMSALCANKILLWRVSNSSGLKYCHLRTARRRPLFYRRLFGDVVASAVVFQTISHMLILLYWPNLSGHGCWTHLCVGLCYLQACVQTVLTVDQKALTRGRTIHFNTQHLSKYRKCLCYYVRFLSDSALSLTASSSRLLICMDSRKLIIPVKARDYGITGVGLSVCLSVCLLPR